MQEFIKKRSAGVLLPVFSLPSPYGIGTLGKEAYRFADNLKRAGQSCWQILPLGQPGAGNSPYSCVSSFAGNPLLIDLDLLKQEGLLKEKELKEACFGTDPEHVDYEKLEKIKLPLLRKAYERGKDREREKQKLFFTENESWLQPYSAFQALKQKNSGLPWNLWPERIYRQFLQKSEPQQNAEFYVWLQYIFFKQWDQLRTYVNRLGIRIIGDLPVYVPFDSADVWSEPEQFRLSENFEPDFVSGVPPDAFSEKGQLWGNPLYNYDKMRADGYGWWIRRVGAAAKLYDVIRIDHFRGFASYYCIPAGEPDALNGHWEQGPGMDLVGRLASWFSGTSFIAEDLGLVAEDVEKLLTESGLPGMRVLEFAFGPGGDSFHLPYHYEKNLVCYTGTHDNAPLALWEQEADRKEIALAHRYLGLSRGGSLTESLIREALRSIASLAVIPMQDWLGLGKGARINVPGVAEGNWTWRMQEKAFTGSLSKKIKAWTELYGRNIVLQD